MLRKAKQETPSSQARSEFSEAAAVEEKAPETTADRTLVDSYGDVRIYRVKGERLLHYEVPAPRYRGEEKALVESILDLAATTINVNEALLQTRSEKRAHFATEILAILDKNPQINLPANAKSFYVNAVVREMVGFGLIDPLIYDDGLEEIMLIGVGKPVYVFHRKFGMMKTNIFFYNDSDVFELIDRIARNVGRHIDLQSPLLDARLADGTRVNATIPP